MYRLLLFIVLAIAPLVMFSQEKPEKTDFDGAKSKMVLRSNTRDQMYMVKNNLHQKQLTNRRKAVVNRQQKMMQQKMHQIQHRRIQKQRMIQQRKIKQQAMRRRQMQHQKP